MYGFTEGNYQLGDFTLQSGDVLPDAFLGYTLPFYHGCPNANEYFPPESFIPIDINDLDRTADIIR